MRHETWEACRQQPAACPNPRRVLVKNQTRTGTKRERGDSRMKHSLIRRRCRPGAMAQGMATGLRDRLETGCS